MKKTRPSRKAGIRWRSFVVALGLCGFLAVSGFGYIWHRNRNVQLVREIRQERTRLVALRGRLAELDRQQARLESFPELYARVRRLELGLVMPLPEQILRLPDWGPALAPPEGGTVRLAARAAGRRGTGPVHAP